MGKKKAVKMEEDDDMDALLNNYMSAEDEKHKASTAVVPSVAPRANFASAASGGKIWMHGGETFIDEYTTVTHDDLHVHNTATGEWSSVKSAGTRKPCGRNAHQAVIVDNALFVYGGEYLSKNGDDVIFLADLWRLDLEHLRWNDITGLKLPSARGGHRMAAVGEKSFAIFGGYFDNGRSLKKFNDVGVVQMAGDLKGVALKLDIAAAKPKPRSAMCVTSPQPGMLSVYGGSDSSCKALSDLWVLDLSPALRKEKQQLVWREVQLNNGPGPRLGVSSLSIHGGLTYLFGGLSEVKQEGKKRKQILQHNDLWSVGPDMLATPILPDTDSPSAPCPRMSTSSVHDVTTNHLYILGGIVEGKAQQTLGDMWKIDLANPTAWQRVGEGENVMAMEEEEECEEEEDEESCEDEDMEEDEEEEAPALVTEEKK